jgi:hypothetical protein
VGAMFPKKFVDVCESNGMAKLLDGSWIGKFQEWGNFDVAGLLGSGYQYGKSVVFKALENFSGFVDIIVPSSVEDVNIIKEVSVSCL